MAVVGLHAYRRRAASVLHPDSSVWGLGGQGLNGASSLLVAALVARTSSVEVFGQFTLTMVCYTIVTSFSRATIGQILLITPALAEAGQRLGGRRSAVALGVLAGAAGAAIQVGVTSGVSTIALLMLVGLPIMALHDWHRYVLLATRLARRSAMLDAAWLTVMVLAYVIISAVAGPSTEIAVGSWVAGAAAGLALGALWVGRSSGPGGIAFLRSERESLRPLMQESVALIVAGTVILYILAWTSGVASLGQYRAAQVALAPMITLVSALQVLVLRDLGLGQRTGTPHVRSAVRLTGIGIAGVVLWVAALLLLSDGAGAQLLGDAWLEGRELLLPQGLAVVGSLAAASCLSYVKVMRSTRLAWRLRARVLWTEPLLGSAGALVAAARGAAWMVFASQVILLGSVLHWMRLAPPETVTSPDGSADPPPMSPTPIGL